MTKRTFCGFISVALFSGARDSCLPAVAPVTSAVPEVPGAAHFRGHITLSRNAGRKSRIRRALQSRQCRRRPSGWRLSGDIQYLRARHHVARAAIIMVIAKNLHRASDRKLIRSIPAVSCRRLPPGELDNGVAAPSRCKRRDRRIADLIRRRLLAFHRRGMHWAPMTVAGALAHAVTKAMYRCRGRSLERRVVRRSLGRDLNWVPRRSTVPAPAGPMA